MGNNYFNLPKEYSDYNKSQVVVLPCGLEKTTSYAKGTSRAPQAILEASHQVEFYDEELESEPFKVGIHTLNELKFENMSLENSFKMITSKISPILDDKKLPLVIGGEHSITPAIISAYKKFHKTMTVLQLDAHADLREEYDGTKLSHACAMARTREMCPVVHVGIRNLSKEEALLVKQNNLPVFFAYKTHNAANWIQQVVSSILTDDVYISIDVDAFDSSIMPDTGTPEPGGLTWWDVTGLIKEVSKHKKIIGYDIVELLPRPDHHASDFMIAKLAYKCIGYWSSASTI